MKAILLICDGLGDLPDENGRTPLSAAEKPNIDRLCAEGRVGEFVAIKDTKPESDTAHLAIFGYDIEKYYTGRGPFEALGENIPIKHGDIAFRANLATLRGGNIIDRRAGRIEQGADQLFSALQDIRLDNAELIAEHSVQHRGAVILRGEGLSYRVSDTDPHTNEPRPILECKPLDQSYEAQRTAQIVNDFTKKSIEALAKCEINRQREEKNQLPGNAILLRGAGEYREVPTFLEKYGLSSKCVAAGALYKGVARYIGMDTPDIPGATATYTTDLKAKLRECLSGLEGHDFVFVHVKGTDNAGHDGKFEQKMKMIERVDKELVSGFPDGVVIAVTGDHCTPVSKKDHSIDPTPILIRTPGDAGDSINGFDELQAKKGSLGRIYGTDLMPLLLKSMERKA
ncbi:MAG: 2,3-bisphosphoglycerate-independent phosphoglycerate mutase [archaeon]